MSNFVTDDTLPTLYADKVAVLPVPQGLTEVNVPQADNLNKLKQSLFDVRTAARAEFRGAVSSKTQGPRGTGTDDDTDALLAWLDDCSGDRYGVLQPGVFLISDTLELSDMPGFLLQGAGLGRCLLKWNGPNDRPMIRVKNSQNVKLRGFRMQGNTASGNLPTAFIESVSDTTYARTYVPTALGLSELVLGSGSAGEANCGIVYSNTGASSDTNNSEGTFLDVLIQGVVDAGYSFEHSQAKAHRITGGGVVGARCAVATNRNGGGGSFSWVEAAASNCSVVCFDLGGPNDPIYIERLMSEGCTRLLTTGGPGGGTFGVTLQSCRFATNSLHADNKAVIFKYRGPFNMFGCVFDSGGNPADLEFAFSADGAVNILGNAWNSPNSDATKRFIFSGSPGVQNIDGNVYSDAVGQMVAQANSGSFTVTGAATTGAVTFAIPENSADYRLGNPVPTVLTGSPAAGSTRVLSVAKTTSGFNVTLEAAPGLGSSVTFDWTKRRS